MCLTLWDLMDCSPPGCSLSTGFPRQGYWSGLPFPSPGDLPDPRIEPVSFMSPALAGRILLLSHLGSSFWNPHAAAESLQSCLTLCNPMDYRLPGSSVHEDSPGRNTGVDSHSLLQGIFPTQGWNLGLPYCRQILYHLSHKGSPSRAYKRPYTVLRM